MIEGGSEAQRRLALLQQGVKTPTAASSSASAPASAPSAEPGVVVVVAPSADAPVPTGTALPASVEPLVQAVVESTAAAVGKAPAPSDGAAAPVSPTTPTTPAAPSPLERIAGALARLLLVPAGSAAPEASAASTPAPVHELVPERVAALVADSGLDKEVVRPLVGLRAFGLRARAAWLEAAEVDNDVRQRLVAEGIDWTQRAQRAGRALDRALSSGVSLSREDRAVQALIRTALLTLAEVPPASSSGIDALGQLNEATARLSAQLGVPLVDPLAGGRHDVPGFLQRLRSDRSTQTAVAVLVFVLPVVVFGLLYVAWAG